MGALTIQPLSVLQETVNQNPVQMGAPSSPSTNANQAQSGGAPQDTVILTGKGADAQLAGGNSNGSQTQQTALFFAAQNIFLGQDNPEENIGTSQVQAPPIPAQAQTPGAPQQTQDSADPAANSGSSTPQEQLVTLDQTLQELGINPQSISLFNRMALLLYANDPAALRVLVQGLQGTAQQSGQSGASNSATNQDNVATGQPEASVQTSIPSAGNGTNDSAQPVPSQAQGTLQQNAPASDSAPKANAAANEFQDVRGQGINVTA